MFKYARWWSYSRQLLIKYLKNRTAEVYTSANNNSMKQEMINPVLNT